MGLPLHARPGAAQQKRRSRTFGRFRKVTAPTGAGPHRDRSWAGRRGAWCLQDTARPASVTLIPDQLAAPVWVQQSAQAEVVMRQELEYGVNFSFAAYRMRAGFGPQTTHFRQIQPLDTVRFAVGLNIGPIRRRDVAPLFR